SGTPYAITHASKVGTASCVGCPRNSPETPRNSESQSEGGGDDGFGLVEDLLQMRLVAEALGVDLVHVLGPGRPGREPAVLCYDLQPADLRAVARRPHQLGDDLL